MKWFMSLLIATHFLPGMLHAKGLDKLQPKTEDQEDEEDKGIVDREKEPSASAADTKAADGTKDDGKKGKDAPKALPKTPEVPIEPGFQDWYIGASISLINIDGAEGDWDASSTGDVELGYRFMKDFLGQFDLYATGRYRPADVTIRLENRAYRGVLESYFVGVKGQMDISKSLVAYGSGEFGLAKTSVSAIDGIQKVDGSLEKSSVDLVIGGGVSYLVLEKLAIGPQLHVGVGAHQTVQLGLDLRFLL